jgi:hypothetical protein
LLAAIHAANPDSSPPATPAPAHVEIKDIPGVLDIPWLTPWQIALLAAAGVAVLALLLWWLLKRAPRRPAAPPPTPRQIALGELARLREQVATLDAYAFSIAVSGVLRAFIEGQFHLRALEQTSPEFLASLAEAPPFSSEDKQLLADFLEHCDMIKFARVEAGPEASRALLESASAFVEGAQA